MYKGVVAAAEVLRPACEQVFGENPQTADEVPNFPVDRLPANQYQHLYTPRQTKFHYMRADETRPTRNDDSLQH